MEPLTTDLMWDPSTALIVGLVAGLAAGLLVGLVSGRLWRRMSRATSGDLRRTVRT